MTEQKPDFTKPVDIYAFIANEFGVCACSEFDAVIETLRDVLSWIESDTMTRVSYDKLLPDNIGTYHIIMGAIDKARLSEHGSSIRHPWLTNRGREFLFAIAETPIELIYNSSGEAYDGLWYQNE